MSALAERRWARRALLAVLALVVLAPVFGWAADAVNYAEPLEHAAEATGASDAAVGGTGLLDGYGVPVVGGAADTLLAALLGTGLTLALALAAARLLET